MGTYGWTEDDINAHRAKRAREAAEADGHVPAPRGETEAPILKACLELCAVHPKIAFAYRNNVGAVRIVDAHGQTRYVKFGPPGSSDILGMIKGGRYFACETKRPGATPTPDQYGFLENVNRGGGLGLWVTSVEQLNNFLKEA